MDPEPLNFKTCTYVQLSNNEHYSVLTVSIMEDYMKPYVNTSHWVIAEVCIIMNSEHCSFLHIQLERFDAIYSISHR